MLYNAVATKIPDKICNILNFTFKTAVTYPAANPANPAHKVAIQGLDNIGKPEVINTAATDAPNGKLPSTVRSGKSKILNVMKAPKARMAKINAVSSVPINS